METLKITQALAEITLAQKKIEHSMGFVIKNAKRDERLRDPFEKDKTTQEAVVQAELQSIADNEKRIVALRMAINKANMAHTITIESVTRTIAEWIIWRRDILPGLKQRLQLINREITERERNYDASMLRIRGQLGDKQEPVPYTYNISEKKLLEEIQATEVVEQQLDGMLSLMNANIDVTV